MSQRRVGPFTIEKQLGVGGMGIVYLATYEENQKKVALKVLSPGMTTDPRVVSRFEREMKILKRLRHPHIVRYYGGGIIDGQHFYAMQFVNGGTIQDVLKKRGRLTWEQALHVGRQVCSALEHAHNAGIVHRDLKPANLFLTKKGQIKLGDFGIARDTEATALTAAGKTVGTYAYMAPEQIQGNHPVSRKTDLYALGCLLYELITGETPFKGDNPVEMLMEHVNSDPLNVRDLVPDCPIELDALIDRLLAKNPDDRPFDALAVHTELGEIRAKLLDPQPGPEEVADFTNAGSGSGLPAVASEKAEDQKKKKKKKKKRKAVPFHEHPAFLGTCLAAVVGLGAWLMWPPGEQSLYMDARQAMESGDETQQFQALEQFITPYLERFPDGTFHGEMTEWSDTVRTDILERQLDKKQKGLSEPKDAWEAAYTRLRGDEKDPEISPLISIESYSGMLDSLESASPADQSDDHGIRIRLVSRRIEQLKSEIVAHENRAELLRTYLLAAEAAAEAGDSNAAEESWNCVFRLFRDVPELDDFHSYARRRLNGEDADVPSAD